MSVTLADLDIRYKNLREKHPDLPKCSVTGCDKPVDITELGQDTSCAYHRLLFDYWAFETLETGKLDYYLQNQKVRRAAFTRWRNRTGKVVCDRIVLMLAQEGINWMC